MRFYTFIGLTLLLSTTAQSAPTQEQIEKWGVYATMAEMGWWEGPDKKPERYRWLVPNEKMLLEIFEPDGTLSMTRTFRVEGKNFINEGLTTATIVSATKDHLRFGPDNIFELDDQGYSVEHRYIYKGKEMVNTYLPIPAPTFPDEKHKSSMAGKVMCPPTRAALTDMLSRVSSELKKNSYNWSVWREYSTSSFRILGAKPNSVTASIVNDELWGLEAMLPGHDVRRYEPLFRAAFPLGKVSCDEYGCKWEPSRDYDDLAEGALSEASKAQTILSETETRFLCNYK